MCDARALRQDMSLCFKVEDNARRYCFHPERNDNPMSENERKCFILEKG
jgi:hypothetical protein